MGCAQSNYAEPLLQEQRQDTMNMKAAITEQATGAAPTAASAAGVRAVEKNSAGNNKANSNAGNNNNTKPSTATPYNRAKDRVDAIPSSKTVICNGIKMTYAYVSQRGFYPEEPFKANQDAYCIHHGVVPNKDDSLFAVFDGHGKDGDGCAIFAKNSLPKSIRDHCGKAVSPSREDMHAALTSAHVQTNQALRSDPSVDDSLSGTTAVSIYFHGRRNRVTVSNLGDSRAVIGQQQPPGAGGVGGSNSNLKALPLSRDQTPYRKDEKARIRATGARVLSLDQLEGLEPLDASENGDELVLGETLDEGGDPPRVWHATEDYPGTAFTRSIGDALAEDLGVYAEPEMLTREMSPSDKILVLASDGVYEFLTNQSVIDICAKFSDPLEACRAVVAEAYELWLQYELRTDDITIICIFIDSVTPDGKVHSKAAAGKSNKKIGRAQSDDDLDPNTFTELVAAEGLRPVRTTVSKEKSKAIQKIKAQNHGIVEEETVDLKQLATFKTAEEKGAIADAIKASIMFRNVSDEQRELIYSCMESIKVKAGTWVIRQGSVGDRFYIVDDGQFEVRIVPDGEEDATGQGGHVIHQYEGSREKHAHPSFGELALMHSAPRSASIVAKTDGHLWALHRAAFRQILVQAQDHRKDLKKALGEIPYFGHLDMDGVNKLAAIMEDITFGRGDTILSQGQTGDKMYVMESGGAYSTAIEEGETKRGTLKAGSFFGEEVLQASETYTQTVVSLQTTTCWMLDIALLKKTMGPLLKK